jgi:hypothetical protein
MSKINCELFDFICQKFKTEKDKKEFEKFAEKCLTLNEVVITPLYNKAGKLMSFFVDSKEAYSKIKDIENKIED